MCYLNISILAVHEYIFVMDTIISFCPYIVLDKNTFAWVNDLQFLLKLKQTFEVQEFFV